jgi:pimeloyl-ACP methyl ester carboxylesterase
MGYSLGTGVAISIAAQRPVAGAILVSPYDHYSLIGLNNSPLYKPLKGIMKPYFDSLSLAPGIQVSMLCLIGSNDTIVSPDLSHRLSSAWAGKTTVIEYPGESHQLLFNDNSSWQDISEFLARFD